MKRYVYAAVAITGIFAGSFALAQQNAPVPPPAPPAQLTLPPNFEPPNEPPPPPEQQPVPCDLKASPDYVPGIDARGRDVAPADVPSGQEVEINTEMFVELRSRNPQLRGTGVVVNLPNLGAPACVPPEENSRK